MVAVAKKRKGKARCRSMIDAERPTLTCSVCVHVVPTAVIQRLVVILPSFRSPIARGRYAGKVAAPTWVQRGMLWSANLVSHEQPASLLASLIVEWQAATYPSQGPSPRSSVTLWDNWNWFFYFTLPQRALPSIHWSKNAKQPAVSQPFLGSRNSQFRRESCMLSESSFLLF